MLRVLVAVVLVLTATGMATTGPVDTGQSSPPQTQMGLSIAGQEFDQKTFRINVSENGSARWTFVYRRDLANQTERRQFIAFAEEFDERTGLYTNFKKRAGVLTSLGTNETGRQMNATAFTRQAHVGVLNNSGVVKMSFHWSNFSEIKGNRRIVGDVFEGGLYIGPNQRLAVTWDDNLSFGSASPNPDDRSEDTVTWTGQGGRQFYDSKPKVVLKSTTASASNAAATETSVAATSRQLWPFGFGVLAFLLITAVVAYRSDTIRTRFENRIGSETDPDSIEPTNGSKPNPTALTEAELMTDEDRVLSLLRENDGRMKQVNIVNETGWSKSKVSMLLSDMDEEGLISKLRVGRENIISLAGDEPEAARSPFEDNG